MRETVAYFSVNTHVSRNFMKTLIIFTISIFIYKYSNCQSYHRINKWFYNLPIKRSSDEIKTNIKLNQAFVELTYYDTSNVSKTLDKPIYSGHVTKPNLSYLEYIDSATIKLYSGFRTENIKGLKTVLVFEYFIKDSSVLNYFFELGVNDLKKRSRKHYSSISTSDKNSDYGLGNIYQYDKKITKASSIWIKYYENGRRSLMILFENSDQ